MGVPAEQLRQITPAAERVLGKRSALLRLYEQDHLRRKLRGSNIIRTLREIDEEFQAINARMRDGVPITGTDGKPVVDANGVQVRSIALTDDEKAAYALRITVLKQRADMQFKKLNKILPDLKGVELTDPTGANPLAPLLGAVAEAAREHGAAEEHGSHTGGRGGGGDTPAG